MRPLLAAGASVVLVTGLGIAWYMGSFGADATDCGAAQVAGADIGGPFELVNAAGETVSDADVITEPSLVYFGYTFCPDVCPFDVARNADAVDLLAERGISVTPVFITVDPARDTPKAVGDFAANMHPKMIGLTGSAEQIAAASAAYRTYYSVRDDGTEDYLVDHSTFTYLMLPDVGFVDFFRRSETAEEIADRTSCHVSRN